MANVQHKNIQHADCHEPKHITTSVIADAGKIITPSSSIAGSSELRRLTDIDMAYSDKTKNIYGWNDIADTQYTSGAPRAIAAGIRTKLTNNALGAQTDTSRLGPVWNTTNNWFVISELNSAFLIRISAKIKAAAAVGTPYTVKFEAQTSNGPTVFLAQDYTIKGGSYENDITFNTIVYNGPFVNGFNTEIYLTPDTAITLYNVGFVVQRTYKET